MKTRTPEPVKKGQPAWPKGGENPAMRKMYDDLLAEDPHLVTYTWETRR